MNSGAHVLIVDDEVNLRRTLADILTDEGHVVEAVSSAAEAVVCCRRTPFDVVLLDMRLADGNGLGVFREMRRCCPASRCILMSAFSEDEPRQAALDEGALAFLAKPLAVESVLRLLAQR